MKYLNFNFRNAIFIPVLILVKPMLTNWLIHLFNLRSPEIGDLCDIR